MPFVVLFLLLWLPPVWAAMPSPQIIHRAGLAEGLTNSIIYDMATDPLGRLWVVAPGSGVYIYTGTGAQQIALPPDIRVQRLQMAGPRVYLATNGGLFRVDIESLQLEALPWLAERSLIRLHLNGQQLWVVDHARKLWLLDTDSGHSRRVPLPLDWEGKDINVLQTDAAGNLWLGIMGTEHYPGALFYLAAASHWETPELVQQSEQLTITAGSIQNETLWISTSTSGIWQLDLRSREMQPYLSVDMDTLRPMDLAWVGDCLWLAGLGGMLQHCGHSQRLDQHYSFLASLPDNDLYRLHFDAQQSLLWVAGYQNGIAAIYLPEQPAFDAYLPGTGQVLSSGSVFAVYHDHQQGLWLGHNGAGIDYIHPDGSWQHFRVDDAVPRSNHVIRFYQSRQGDLLVGTFGGGAWRLNANKQQFERWPDKPTLENLVVTGFAEDDQSYWVSTIRSLLQLDLQGRVVQRLERQDLPGSGLLFDVKVVGDQVILATGAGLVLYQSAEGKLQPIQDLDGDGAQCGGSLSDLAQDAQGRIWFSGAALCSFDPATGQVQRWAEDITSLSGLAVAANGDIWGYDNELVHFSPVTGLLRRFNANEGLFLAESVPSFGAISVAGDAVWFATTSGLMHFNALAEPSLPKPLFGFAALKNNEHTLQQGFWQRQEPVTIAQQQSLLRLSLQAIDFFPRQLSFQYRLAGHFEQWLPLPSLNDFLLPGFAPGEQQLAFRVLDQRGQPLAHLDFTSITLAPWWQRPPFVALWLLLVSVLVALGVRARFYQLRKQRNQLALQVAERTAELQRLLREKEVFYAQISHEFRTPLTLILLPAQQLLAKADNSRPELAQRIVRNAHRLLQLVEQLLQLARSESANHLPKVRYQLNHEVTHMVELLQPMAQERQQQLLLDVPQQPCYLTLHQGAMGIMVSNLVVNAIKYSPRKTTIHVQLEVEDDALQLSVTDQGPGIAVADMQRIFTAFERLETASASQQGYGIGLHVVKQLCELHGGTLSYQSLPAGGSCFTIRLPYCAAEVASPATESSPLPSGFETTEPTTLLHKQVLVVEDDDDLRQQLAELLSDSFTVQLTASAEEALQRIEQDLPDLVVSDVMLPGQSGIELAALLKQDPNYQHIPVVLLTALSSPETQKAGMLAAADDYLLKPFDAETLRLKLSNLLRTLDAAAARMRDSMRNLDRAQLEQKIVNDEFIDQLLHCIEEHLSETDFNVDCLASQFCMTDRTLRRKVQQKLAMTPVELLRSRRLQRAATQLKQSCDSIQTIAVQCGFSQVGYFNRLFKEHFGLTPSEYRQTPPPAD